MNPSHEKTPDVDRELLEVLVDGELPDRERRDLLERLERTPGGWRACALAFLEAQCLGESLGKLGREPLPMPRIMPQPRPSRGVWARHAGTLLAMAASFLAVLGVGWWVGGLRRSGDGMGRPGPTADLAVVEPGPAMSGPGQSPSPRLPITTVALPGLGADGREVRLPVVERDQLDHSVLYPDAQGIPSQLREVLRRAGYQVRQSHDLLPVPVEDGRHAIVPVDQLDIHYVGNHVE